MEEEEEDNDRDQGKRKRMRTSSTINRHHLFDLLPNLFDLLSEQVINLFNLLPEEVIIDQILIKLPEEYLIDLLPYINPFDLLPEEVIIDQILLKLPVESLLSLRCVSKCLRSLITNPSFVQLHTQLAQDHHSDLILFSTHAYKEDDILFRCDGNRHYMYECEKNYLIRNYICKFSAADDGRVHPEVVEEMNCPFPSTDIRASCNGLLYVHGRPICAIKKLRNHPDHCFSQGYVYTCSTKISRRISPSYIWNPCTKEYKELPPPPPSKLLKDRKVVVFDDIWSINSNCNSAGFCGFGYDRANDEYKILYYEHLSSNSSISSVPTTEFKVYTLRTNTWTSISDNPYKSLFFGQQWERVGIFVNGALHWIMSSDSPPSRRPAGAKIISFDIEKEVFQEIQKPPPPPPVKKKDDEYCYTDLQMLQGCLCVCQSHPPIHRYEEIDIWMLKDYAAKDSWTKFCKVGVGRPFPYSALKYFKLLRYCVNGDIVMLMNHGDLVLYNPVYHRDTSAKKFIEDVKGIWLYQMNFRKTLVSLNSGTYTN